MADPLDDHFHNPRNAGVLEDADLHVQADNPVCGDILHLYLKRDEAGRVAASRFQVYGCPAAIAAGSLLTELVQGRSREELREIDQDAVARGLGGLSAEKLHAATLAGDTIRRAVQCWGARG